MTPTELARYWQSISQYQEQECASRAAYKKELAEYIMPLKKPIPDMVELISELNFRPIMTLSPPLRRGNFKFHGDAPIEIVGSEGVDDTNYPHKLTWKLSCGCTLHHMVESAEDVGRAKQGMLQLFREHVCERLTSFKVVRVVMKERGYTVGAILACGCRAEIGLPKMMQVMGGQRLMTLRDEAVAVEEYLTAKYGSHVCRAEVIQF